MHTTATDLVCSSTKTIVKGTRDRHTHRYGRNNVFYQIYTNTHKNTLEKVTYD